MIPVTALIFWKVGLLFDMQSDRYRITLGAMDVSLQSRDDVIAQSGSIGRPFCYEIYDKITLEMLEQLELA